MHYIIISFQPCRITRVSCNMSDKFSPACSLFPQSVCPAWEQIIWQLIVYAFNVYSLVPHPPALPCLTPTSMRKRKPSSGSCLAPLYASHPENFLFCTLPINSPILHPVYTRRAFLSQLIVISDLGFLCQIFI